MIRVLILAADAETGEALHRELMRVFDVVAQVGDADGGAATVARLAPDVVVVDELGAGADVVRTIRKTRAAAPGAKLLLLAANMESEWLHEASLAGIDAALTRTLPAAALGTLVHQIIAGSVFHAFADTAPAAVASAAAAGLTERELQILRLVAAGLSNGRIAAQLWVTEQTVKFHLSNTYRKLGVTNRTEASHYAYARRLVELHPVPPVGAGQAA